MSLYMQQTHFGVWAELKSPLITGADLRTLSNDSLSVLTNRDIIVLNQGPPGVPLYNMDTASIEGSLQVWTGDLQRGAVVLAFNEKSHPQHVSLSLTKLGPWNDQPVFAKELCPGEFQICGGHS